MITDSSTSRRRATSPSVAIGAARSARATASAARRAAGRKETTHSQAGGETRHTEGL